jgi:predicted regulator of Ras-like GTPase activity (Roadblock/LC7/MglB family)
MSTEFMGMTAKETESYKKIKTLLSTFKQNHPDVQGQMVVIFPEGLPVANSWEGEMDEILIGAVAAAIKLTFEHLCVNLKKGKLNRLFINSEKGKIVIQNTGTRAILCSIMNFDVDQYRLIFMTSVLGNEIAKILGGP